MKKLLKKIKKIKLSKKAKSFILGFVAAVLVIVFLPVFLNSNEKDEAQIITKANLERIINASDLSTLEAVYNGVAKVTDEDDPDEVAYYVSYDAKVKAGIDFKKVEIDVDKKEKIITVTVPKTKINDINVDINSLDYIFIDDDAITETVSEQAYKKCIEDVTKETKTEDAIYKLAEENTKNVIQALINPFVTQLDEEYQLVIK